MESYWSLMLYSFFFILYYYPDFSDWVITIDLSLSLLIIYSAYSNLLLTPYSKFFIPIIVLFNSRIFIWFLFINLISTDIPVGEILFSWILFCLLFIYFSITSFLLTFLP